LYDKDGDNKGEPHHSPGRDLVVTLDTTRSRHEQAKARIASIQQHREAAVVIHYSCENFDAEQASTPRVTSLAVRNLRSGQTSSFSLHHCAERKGLAPEGIPACLNELEKQMLYEFFGFVTEHRDCTWIHWAMRDAKYGFAAIEHRYKVLGGDPIAIPDVNKMDLPSVLVDLYGTSYVPHTRLINLMRANSIAEISYMDGPAEARAFIEGAYRKIHYSTLRKVDNLAYIFDRCAYGTLVTHSRFCSVSGVPFLELPTRYWHCSARGKTVHRDGVIVNDLTLNQLESQLLVPWHAGRPFVLRGAVFQSRMDVADIEVTHTSEPLVYFEKLELERKTREQAEVAKDGLYAEFDPGSAPRSTLAAGTVETSRLLFSASVKLPAEKNASHMSNSEIGDEVSVTEQFRRLARDAHGAAESFTPHRAAVQRLKESAEEIGKAWSKGWFGYHARIYKEDLLPVRSGEYWDTDLAWDPTADTRGEWAEFANESIFDAVRERAGNPNMEEIDSAVTEIGQIFDKIKNEATAILAAISAKDEFLAGEKKKIESLVRNHTAQEFARNAAPTELRYPLDSRARHEGLGLPPHLQIVGLCFERNSFAKACRQLAVELDRVVTYLSASTKVSLLSNRIDNGVPDMSQENATRVFVIHGRNLALLEELRIWFDSLGLHAKAFDDLRAEMGGSPTIMEVIHKGMTEARAIVVLITPDEAAFLRPEFQRETDSRDDKERWQARPNVLFEAGMAFAMAGSKRTLLLVAGAELFSDVAGIHYLGIPQDAASRDRLKIALRNMGCDVREDPQHHKRGNFSVGGLDKLRTRSPFEGT
jgi:predicted nucleotide-binding protein